MTADDQQVFNYDISYSPYAWWLLAGRKIYGSVMVLGKLPADDINTIKEMATHVENIDVESTSILASMTGRSLQRRYDTIIINTNHAQQGINPDCFLASCKNILAESGVMIMFITNYPVFRHTLNTYPDKTEIMPCIAYGGFPFEAFVPGYYHSNKNQCIVKDRFKTALYKLGAYRFFLRSSILVSRNNAKTSLLLDDIVEMLGEKLPVKYDVENIKLSKYYFKYGKVIVAFVCSVNNKHARYIVVLATDKWALEQRENEKAAIFYIKEFSALAKYAVGFYVSTTVSGFMAYIMDEAEGLTVDAACSNLCDMTASAAKVVETIALSTLRGARSRDELIEKLSSYIARFNGKMAAYESLPISMPGLDMLDDIRKIPVVFMHGDMKLENFVLDKNNQVHKIIDWEQADINGWPLLDLLYLVSYNMHIIDGMNFMGAFKKLCVNDVPVFYSDMILSYNKKLNITNSQYRFLLAIFFVHHYACRVIIDSMTDDERICYQAVLKTVKDILNGD